MTFAGKEPGTLLPIEEVLAFSGMDVVVDLAPATLLKVLLGGVVAINVLSDPLIYAGFQDFFDCRDINANRLTRFNFYQISPDLFSLAFIFLARTPRYTTHRTTPQCRLNLLLKPITAQRIVTLSGRTYFVNNTGV